MASGDWLSVSFIALGLAADCFAVALSGSISLQKLSGIQILRPSFSFGFFQALMLVLGWLAGRAILELIAGYDHWVAFLLLAFVGGHMLWESAHPEKERKPESDITRGWLLITLSLATSIDALTVGLSFAFLDINIALASAIIGSTTFIISIIGFLIGRRLGKLVGRRAETIGGVILIAIGLRILLSHLMA